MHELALCDALLKMVRDISREEALDGVRSITVRVGTLSGVIPHFLTDCWVAVTDGTEYDGVPLRVEIGPKDIEAGRCVAVRRDNGEKITVALDELEARIPALLEDVQQGLFDKAKRNLDEHTYAAHSLAEAKELQEKNGGFIKTMWCGDLACELEMKDKAGMSSRCIPFEQEHLDDVCPVCGKPAKCMIYWGVAY